MDLLVFRAQTGTVLDWGAGPRRCAIGPAGIGRKHREGDGVTPQGTFPIREIFYRADRMTKPIVHLPLRALARNDGWCDAPADPRYNQLVKLPYAASAETMWRDDHLYDLVAVIGFNDDPVVAGKGSAIFLHLAGSVGEGRGDQEEPDYTPTAGCIALTQSDLLAALEQLRPGDNIIIG